MDLSDILNTNTKILLQAASKMGIKVELIDKEKLKLRLTNNGKTKTVTKKSFGLNPSRAIKISKDKEWTNRILRQQNIPVPKETKIRKLKELEEADLPPFSLVVKPAEGEKGHDVFVGIQDKKTLKKTIESALKKVNAVIVQESIDGNDMRFFVLNGKVIGAALRHPPELAGDGVHTIEQLIDSHNQKLLDERKHIGKRMQNRIINWPRVKWHLANQGLSLQTIPAKGKTIEPYPITNFQAGGTVETIPLSQVHPSIVKLAEKAAIVIGLVVCGIDMIIKNHTRKALTGLPAQLEGMDLVSQRNAVVLEVNSDPSLRLHEWPNKGRPQPVAKKLLEFIFSS